MPRRCRVCARRGAFSRLRASARDAKNRCLDVRLGAQAIFADFSAVVARHRAVGKAGGSAERAHRSAATQLSPEIDAQSDHVVIVQRYEVCTVVRRTKSLSANR